MNTLFDFIEETHTENIQDILMEKIKNNQLSYDVIGDLKAYILDLSDEQFYEGYQLCFNEFFPCMIDNGAYEYAFKMISILYIKASHVQMNTKAHTFFIQETVKKLTILLAHLPFDKIYLWFMSSSQEITMPYMLSILAFLIQHATNPIHLQYLHEFIKEDMKTIPKEYTESFALSYLDVMNKLHFSNQQIVNELKHYFHLEKVIRTIVDQTLNNQEYLLSIELIKLYIDNRLTCFVEYQIILKELYKKTNNSDAYKQQLFLLVSIIDPQNTTLLNELKSLYTPNQWQTIEKQLNSINLN